MIKSTVKPSTTLPAKTKPTATTTPKKKPSTPAKPNDKPTPKPTPKPAPKPATKPATKQVQKPVEETPSKPVKETVKVIDSKVMKEKTEQKDAMNIKANGDNPAAKNPSVKKSPEKDVRFEWTPTGAEKVQITGSFNNWQEKLDMKHVGDKHELSIPLKPGKYSYKFIVDGEWCYDFTCPNECDDCGNWNNTISV